MAVFDALWLCFVFLLLLLGRARFFLGHGHNNFGITTELLDLVTKIILNPKIRKWGNLHSQMGFEPILADFGIFFRGKTIF